MAKPEAGGSAAAAPEQKSTETVQEERKREAKNDRKKRSWQSHEIKKETKLRYQSLTFEPQSLTICAAILEAFGGAVGANWSKIRLPYMYQA